MGKIILVIDDDSDDREFFREALQETDRSAHFISAGNGHEALELLTGMDALIPDFIFLDLNMPRLDGKECLVLLRKMPSLRKIPIIIFTTSKLFDEGEVFLKLGADLCLTKPLLFSDLKKMVQNIVVSGMLAFKNAPKY